MYTDRSTAPASARSAGRLAYHELKRRLLLGDFPLGRRLGEVALAEAFGTSRTPVREALARLDAEGLVTRLAEGGYAPNAPDLHTIGELYGVRRALELAAIDAADGHDPARLASLRDDWRDLANGLDDDPSGPDFVLADEDFHLRLAEAAGNLALVEILGQVNERIRFVRMHDFLTPDRVARTVTEHLGIVEALLDGDRPAARTRLIRHIGLSHRVVEQRAALALSRMLASPRAVR